jgi:hypothetical protein
MTNEQQNDGASCALCGEPATEVFDGEPVCTKHADQREDEAAEQEEERQREAE